ncbi:sensor histidine kinase [Nocardioides marmoribigeumensis]|uniref:Signal transduction histidine kinase n=1 Tax=Nocardioides marmoribigeumensis TaxID=433649 RepID=A0ABU2BWD3_9ACTN|nr:histidine kinase [Nocardioides marmoribigeumensis]MDR7362591.1 signal transduction histidine kinase [Nocardioides marmoribigeumensis]
MAARRRSLRTIRAAVLDEWERRGRTRSVGLACLAGLIALLVVVGWFLEVEVLVSPGGHSTSTKFVTAVMSLTLGAAVVTLAGRVRDALAAATALVAFLIVVEWVAGVSLGLDQAVVDDFLNPAAAGVHPGRPSILTCLCFVSLAGAVVLVPRGRDRLGSVLAWFPAALGLVAIFAHVYDAREIYRAASTTAMAAPTGVMLVLLSLAVLLTVPHGALQWMWFGTDPGAGLLRLITPIALFAIPFIGWLRVQGQSEGLFDTEVGSALLMTVVAVGVIGVTYRAARTAQRIDVEREKLVDELHQVNQELEERVRSRSVQINRQRTRLALLEERDRIARDLHDRVIQRIFAAGLQVAALGRTARKIEQEHGDDRQLGESLNSVARELDMAIRELRNSIFELTSIGDHDDIEQVLIDIATRSSRILGFMPAVTADGLVDGLAPDLVAQVASVIQEALSNIARHARASHVTVSLVGTDHDLTVEVTDDGVGLPDPLPRSSGISNLMNRARNLNGTATWSANEPRGTVMTWRVPRRPGDTLDRGPEPLLDTEA